ncbi:hypothetical protein C8039_12690 [Halogeometricum sp. wsp3]|nr:hypothetical protein C8039_12690 [Halogeometricum sp. wsp3]
MHFLTKLERFLRDSEYRSGLRDWSREAEVRHGRIQERITGNQNMLESMVAEYNARSDDATRSKSTTVVGFSSKGLFHMFRTTCH